MASEMQPRASVMVSNSVAMEVGTNNLVMMGAFDGLESPTFPAHSTFYAVAKVWGMPVQEENAVVLRLVNPADGSVVAEAGTHRFGTDDSSRVHTAIGMFRMVTIPHSGVYEVRAYSGEDVIGSFPIHVGSPVN